MFLLHYSSEALAPVRGGARYGQIVDPQTNTKHYQSIKIHFYIKIPTIAIYSKIINNTYVYIYLVEAIKMCSKYLDFDIK